MKYFASNHGGLNEYKNRVWKRREGNDLRDHFKEDEGLDERQLAARKARLQRVFVSPPNRSLNWAVR